VAIKSAAINWPDGRWRFGLRVAVLLAPILLLSGWLLAHEWLEYSAARDAVRGFRSFEATLLAMEKVSAERGPTNGVLGQDLPMPPARAAALRNARATSDAQLARLLDTLDPARCNDCGADRDVVLKLEEDLAAARRNVDRLATVPVAERGDLALEDAVNRMIAVIPEFLPVVVTRTGVIASGDTGVLSYLILARLTVDLREYAGQLGSRFTSALAMHRALTVNEQFAIERTLGRIEQLRAMIDTAVLERPEQVAEAFAVMHLNYFGDGERYVATVRSQLGGPDGAPVSAAEFAARYVPTMRSIVQLRDTVLVLAQNEVVAHSRRALLILVGTGLIEALLIAGFLVAAARMR
jgi:hypothetical protein